MEEKNKMTYVKATDVGNCYFMQESTRGTFKLPVAAMNANWIARQARLQFVEQFGREPVRVIGKYGIDDLLNVGKAYMMQLFFVPTATHSINFLKFAFNESGGTGSALASLSLCFSLTSGGATYYIKLKNAQLAGASLGFRGRGSLAARVDISAILDSYDTNTPTYWTLISDPATAKLKSTDGGASPLTIQDLTTLVKSTPRPEQLFFNVRNGLDFIDAADSDTWIDNPVSDISRTVTLGFSRSDEVYRLLANTGNFLRATWTIKTSTHSLEFDGGKFDSSSLQVLPGGGVLRHQLTMVEAKTVALS